MKDALESGELDKQEYYRQILRLVYRIIFLFVAEERDALLDPNATEEARERYRRYYAARRLRDLAEKRRGGPHCDLWRGLALVMEKLDDGYPALGLPALGSRLWGPTACPWLMDAECANDHLLTAIRHLSHIQEGKTRYPVNWRNVGADELGSIYESLLERHPRLHREAATFELETAAGHERKTTGSYYTPTSLVDHLLDSALDPVLDEACKKPAPEQAILDLKVCDPACGSGHFLVAAARRIAKRLAAARSGDDEPSPRDVQKALRDVVGRCIYGVDLNPMAVELCKVSLWMEAIEPGNPLSFLDSHIQCGNALLGATPALMSRGIPNDAYKPIAGDDKSVAKRLKKRNRDERKGQTTLFGLFSTESGADYKAVATQAAGVEMAVDDNIAALREKERRWDRLSRSAEFKDAWFRADAWCAAFIWPKQPGDPENGAITHDAWRRIERDVTAAPANSRKITRDLARQHRFFHWHLAFLMVFGEAKQQLEEEDTAGWTGGFDVILGNPPWGRTRFEEKEWFASRDPDIARAPSKAARQRLINALHEINPKLFDEYRDELRTTETSGHFARASGRYPLCARGDINSYALFAELGRKLLQSRGRVGLIVPSGIVADDTYKGFFTSLVDDHALIQCADFENNNTLFPGVGHGRMRFCLLSYGRHNVEPEGGARFLFLARRSKELDQHERWYRLAADDFLLLNPNSRTCPVFLNGEDAELTKRAYRRFPILAKDGEASKAAWGAKLHRVFDMTNDAALFLSTSELHERGWTVATRQACRDGNVRAPIVEGKMVSFYDHRASHIRVNLAVANRQQQAEATSAVDKENPGFFPDAYLWVSARDTQERISQLTSGGWLPVFKRVTAATNWRTMVGCVLPTNYGISYTLYVLTVAEQHRWLLPCLVAVANSFCFDFFIRQKTMQPSLPMGVIYETVAPPPAAFTAPTAWTGNEDLADWITPRFVELVATSSDLTCVSEEFGLKGRAYRWDDARRAVLRAELDAAALCLFGLTRHEAARILDTFPKVEAADRKEHSDYRTKLQILDIYDAMQRAIDTGEPYQTALEPPPADARAAHPEGTLSDWAPAPERRPSAVPIMPNTMPAIDPRQEPMFVVWALLHANGGAIRRTELARAFALRSQPAIITRLAPAHLATVATEWASKVGQRNVAAGTLAQAVAILADRDGIRLTTDEASRSLVTPSDHTPQEDQIDEWYRFEARLALDVLAALPPADVHEVDAGIAGEDRDLLEAGGT